MKLTTSDVGKVYRNKQGDWVRIDGVRGRSVLYTRYLNRTNAFKATQRLDQGFIGHGSCLGTDGVFPGDNFLSLVDLKLRKREIGRKFKTRNGKIAELVEASLRKNGRWGVKVDNGPVYYYDANGKFLGGGEECPFDLVERLPVEKPDPFMGFKVGDVVDFLCPDGITVQPSWTGVRITELKVSSSFGPAAFAYNMYGNKGLSEIKYCRHHVAVKKKPYPDYKRMKAGLERIRDHSPIGSNAALWAKDALEPLDA